MRLTHNGMEVNSHVASIRFGTRADGSSIGRFDKDNLVGQSILNLSKLSQFSATLLLREAYDCTFGIYGEAEAADPMSVMKMHPHEDYVTDGSVMVLMNRIINAKLPSLTGMSLLELMEMPPSLLEPLLKTGNKKVEGESKVADDLLNSLEE